MKYFISLIALLIFIQSCTIEKRHYTNGFHVEWNKKFKNELSVESNTSTVGKPTEKTDPNENQIEVPVSTNLVTTEAEEKHAQSTNHEEEKKWKQASKPNSQVAKPVAVAQSNHESNAQHSPEIPVPNDDARLSLFFGMLTWLSLIAAYFISINITFFIPGFGLIILLSTLLFAILAVTFGNRALGEIDIFPNKYSNRGQASAGLLLGLTYLILLIVAALLLILLISLFLGI